jgi:glycine/D-amino acid oxidase-like deaminating enzyme
MVEVAFEDFQAFAHGSCPEVRPARRHHTRRFARCVGVDDVNSLAHQYNIALPDVVIAGAGIVGAACARELSRAGLKVEVWEQSGVIGGGATAAGMGHLAVMDDSDAQFALTSFSQRLWREIADELPASAEYLPCGSLWVAADDEEMEEVHRKHRFYTERGIPVEVLDSGQLAGAEPNLRPNLAGGLIMPADSVCYPPCAAAHFLEGIPVRLNTPMREIPPADVVILATGTAVTHFVPDAPVYPRKGHLLITDRYPDFLNHQLIELGYLKSAHSTHEDSVAFNAQPRKTGQILIGSSRQYGVEDPRTEPHMLERMLARAVEYMPALAKLSAIRTWTGFRAATPDKLPLIGHWSDNVYLATGHEGLGISTSLATARLLADEILGRESVIAREPYRPDRSFDAH